MVRVQVNIKVILNYLKIKLFVEKNIYYNVTVY